MMFDGVIELKVIVKQVWVLNFFVVVLIDCNGFYVLMVFLDVVKKDGVQLIIGMMLGICWFDIFEGIVVLFDWIVFYVQNEMGYDNFCVFVLMVYFDCLIEQFVYVDFDVLVCYIDGLIVLIVGGEGGFVWLFV